MRSRLKLVTKQYAHANQLVVKSERADHSESYFRQTTVIQVHVTQACNTVPT